MGSDAADFNNDGYSDIISIDMLGETHQRQKTTIAKSLFFQNCLIASSCCSSFWIWSSLPVKPPIVLLTLRLDSMICLKSSMDICFADEL